MDRNGPYEILPQGRQVSAVVPGWGATWNMTLRWAGRLNQQETYESGN